MSRLLCMDGMEWEKDWTSSCQHGLRIGTAVVVAMGGHDIHRVGFSASGFAVK